MYKPIICFTITVFGLGVAAETLDKADVPHIFGDDGFVAMSSTGSASPSGVFTVQNMNSGDEITVPPSETDSRFVVPFTDPSSGSTT